jgi:carbonic anhydrase
MQKLVQGIHDFQRTIFSEKQRLFERLAGGQSPQALFITCSDSRIDPSLLTQTEPGDLFILRTAGNIVPPYGTPQVGEAGTIEYAVAVLKVQDIIVCGHSHCGAMSGLIQPQSIMGLPAVQALLNHAESTRRIIAENYGHLPDGEARVTATIEENVLVQLEHLRTHPSVAAALGRNALTLHGWVYKFETGEVFAYDPAEGQFLPIRESPRVPAHPPDRRRPTI